MIGTLKDYKISKDINLFEKKNDDNKKKPGRPKVEMKRKRTTVVLYLYDDEYDNLKKVAKLESMSSFIRNVLKEKFGI